MDDTRFRTILNYCAILAICFFAGAGNYMNAAINTFQQAFPDVSQSTIMMVATLPGLISVPVMLLAGWLVDRNGSYRGICITGTILIIIGGVLPFFITKSWTFILACRAVLGIGAGCYAIRNSYIVRTVPPGKLVAFTGYSTVALTVGGTASSPVVGLLVAKGWNCAFLYDLLPLFILVLIIFGLKVPEKLPQPTSVSPAKRRGSAKLSWKIYFYALTQFLIIVMLYPLAVSGVSIYFDAYGLGSPAVAGTVMSLFPLSGVIGNLFLNRITKPLKRFTIPAMSLLVILGAALSLLAHTMISVALSYILVGLGYHVIIGVLQVYNGIEAPPEKLAAGSTMILASKSVGIFLSSYFITICTWIFRLQNRINVENSFLGCIIIYLLLMVFCTVVDVTPSGDNSRREKAEQQGPDAR